MEAEGGCFSRKKKDASKSSKGLPIVQPTEDLSKNSVPSQIGNYCAQRGTLAISFLQYFLTFFSRTVSSELSDLSSHYCV